MEDDLKGEQFSRVIGRFELSRLSEVRKRIEG